MNSLDPRVNRLPKIGQPGQISAKAPLDQFGTFEVFVQPKDGKPFQHEGAVHAPDLELAYVLAKETFTRRFLCSSLFVADTRDVFVSPMTEADSNAYDLIKNPGITEGKKESYEIFHLAKRGKQHVHVGKVDAGSPDEALWQAGQSLRGDKVIYNVWVIRSSAIRSTNPEDKDLWLTLPDKKFRDAADYKGGDKLKQFLDKRAALG